MRYKENYVMKSNLQLSVYILLFFQNIQAGRPLLGVTGSSGPPL